MLLKGNVYDSTGTSPISEAIVMAVRLKDSLLLDYTRTDIDGKFQLNSVEIDTFTLIISHFKFEEKSYFIFGSVENREIDIPSIKLNVKSKEIQEVVVYANKNPIYFRGDTIVYVADSFKVVENAVVEDLLKKLPGISVGPDGKITSQGKEISKVYVDGDEFFGTDPTIATKNLGARGVETVEIYETKDENAVDGGDETIQVMNLKLKEEARKGFFGRVSAASDFTQFYESELLFNKFNNSQKISVFMLGTNTPRSGLNREDIDQFNLGNENAYTQNEDGEWYSNNTRNDAEGIPVTLRSGIYFTDKIGKNDQSKIGFDYTFNNYKVNALSQKYSQYFLEDTTYYSSDSTRNITTSEAHTANFEFYSELDSLTTLEVRPSLRFSKNTNTTNDYSNYITEDQILSRNNSVSKSTNSEGLSFDTEIKLNHEFKKEKREIELKYNYKNDAKSSNGNLYYENLYYSNSNENDTTNQDKLSQNSNTTHTSKITYTEPLTKKTKIETEYLFDYSQNEQGKETRNIINPQLTLFDSTYSNKFENLKLQNRLSLTFYYESKKHFISIGSRFRNIQIENYNQYTELRITQNVSNVLPRFSYSYKPSQTKRFHFKYNTSSSQPSINALQPVPDNSNPNKIQVGNPNLKPTFNHQVNFSMNSWNNLSSRYIWAGFMASYTNNAFADSTVFDTIGRQYSKTVNVNGNYWTNGYVGGSIGIYKKILEIKPGANAGYSSSNGFINGESNTKTTLNYGLNLGIDFNLDSVSFSIQSEYGYVSPRSSISALSNTPYSNQKHMVFFEWTLPWLHLTLNSNATYSINGQRAQGYNLSYLIWNASLEKSFLKKQNLILSIHGNDLLNQNIVARRIVNSNVITDYTTTIISRYVLLKLTYKFTNKKTQAEDENGLEE